MDSATAQEEVLEPLERIAQRGHSRYDVFRSWVRLMLAALQRDDDRYLSILEDYDDRDRRDAPERNADLFAKAFGKLQQAMAATNQDVLGDAYESWGMQSDAFGQHFTPHPTSAALAALQLSGQHSDQDAESVTIADPACGSGRLLIHAARDHDQRVVCFGKDTDGLCARMAALNLCFFNVDGIVVHGDSLRTTAHAGWQTHHTPVGGEVERLSDEVLEEITPIGFNDESDTASSEAPADQAQQSADSQMQARFDEFA